MPQATNKHQLHTDKLIKAVLFCVSAHFFFFLMGLGAKYLSASHHVAEIAFYRNFIIFAPMLAFILFTKKWHLLHCHKPLLVILRACIGCITMITVFASLSYLPMAYATVIFFTSSLITPVLAFFFLKEHVGMHRWSAVAVGMIGVIIIAQPSGLISMLGLFLALTAAALHSVVFIMLRAMKTENPITVTLYFLCAGVIISGLFFMPWVAQPILPNQMWLLLLVGLSGGAGQISITSAYKYAPASFITPFSYTALLWNIMADILYWKYDIDLLSIFLGAGLILNAQILLIYYEHANKNKKQKVKKS